MPALRIFLRGLASFPALGLGLGLVAMAIAALGAEVLAPVPWVCGMVYWMVSFLGAPTPLARWTRRTDGGN